jgi:alcohol dehydrogenase class IV
MINQQIFQFPIVYSNGFLMGKIATGWGSHQTVGDECKALNIKKALITTTGLKGTGIVEEIKGILEHHGISTEIFDKVTSNPKDYQVMEASKVLTETGCDGVVSVGGGSSHDCGKGARIVAANDGKYICDFAALIDPPWMQEIKKYKPVTIPQVCVNTTSGTGAEITGGGLISNTKVKVKYMCMVMGVAPKVAINDPLLVRMQPQNIAAWTGFDALTHAFESYVSKSPSRYNRAMMLQSIKLIYENLREFSYNRMNHIACENMCWAASMAGIGLGLGGGAGIVHGLMHGLSALTDCHHGLSNAVFTIPGERYNQPACPDRFAEMAEVMGVDTRNMTKMEASDKWFDEIERLLKDLDIETGNLGKLGLKKEDCPHIVKEQYSNDFAAQGNPRDFIFDDCVKLLEDNL